jgi:UDP-glucose 4-epimerase
VTHLDPREEVVHAFADHSKIERALGHRARWSLAEGLERMAAWAKASGPARPSARQHIELTRNLPPSWTA